MRCITASQSSPPAGGESIEIIFSGGVYVGENTAQSASVRIARLRRSIVRAADCNPLPENRMIFRQAKKMPPLGVIFSCLIGTISRVLYHSALAGGMATVIPLGAQLPVPSSNLPGSVDRADPLPYLVLLRTGLAELVTSPCRLVGSYPTVSPLPPEGGGLLSVALSEDHSPWAFPSVLPCEARTFLSVRHAETRRTRRQSIRLPKT